MFGLVVKFVVLDGKRDEFIDIMSAGFQGMAGCHSYILSEDAEEPNKVWVNEIWESKEAHDIAMASTAIKSVVARAKPLMTGRDLRVITRPRGGQGLAA